MGTISNFPPEEGRPPDSPSSNRKYQTRKHFNSWTYTSDTINNNGPHDHNFNSQHHTLKTKLLCINNNNNAAKQRKSDTSASLKAAPTEAVPKPPPRNSFHQDVEEALQSLLWQPYEYQTPDQWPAGIQSRGEFSPSGLMVEEVVSSLETLEGRAGALQRSACDVFDSDSDMQVEVVGPEHTVSVRHGDGLQSANVVGLPHHPRNGSEPSTAPTRLVPTHLRSASVPKTLGGVQKLPPPSNISNVNVNFYRAVPVNVVSAVPTIQCLNTTMDEGNSVSNVQIMPLGNNSTAPLSTGLHTGTTQVTVHTAQPHQITPPPITITQPRSTRTFTSTEAQTDEITVCPPPPQTFEGQSREQRRKERRERRHQRRSVPNRQTVDSGTQANTLSTNGSLPDLLNSHMPPPYSPLPVIVPPPVLPSVVPNTIVPSGLVAFPPPPGQVPLIQGAGSVAVPVPATTGFRFPFPATGFRRGRFSEEPPKECCGFLIWKPGSLRWFIAVIALVAVCCVLVGTALGAMRPAGRDHLTVSLLMIGVGIVLVTVSGVAWRLTSHDSSTCRSMLGLGSTESVDVCTRRFVPRLPPSYGRPHHPYAAMMYPEFQYRPPPPSYQASMQEYRLRLLLLDRGNTPQIQASAQNAVSPPPTYRSHAGSLLRAPLSSRRDAAQSEYSCPPSYRSQTSTLRPGTLQNSILHSREQSLSLSESNHEEAVVSVVNIHEDITLDSLKLEPDGDLNTLKMLLKGSAAGELEGMKDGNLVTIVQTSDQSPVIVTVSGSSHIERRELPTEMEILAHL